MRIYIAKTNVGANKTHEINKINSGLILRKSTLEAYSYIN